MTRLSTASVLLLAAALGAAPKTKDKPVNLVVNGSFEEGPEFEVYKPLDPDSTAMKGWVVTRGQIDIVVHTGDEWKAADGKRALDLHGSPGFGGVKQTLPTKAGQKYRVEFKMTTNMTGADPRVKMAVRAAGADKEFELESGGRTHADPKWEKLTWEFTAKGDKTELEFHTAMSPPAYPFGGPMLDDVRVIAID
ncbi:MAG TPA: choice-of-anchor C family protein [Gemmataceae bacterium]|nr:choice-of-anchor C family protein [Gemmataceae bacterium]